MVAKAVVPGSSDADRDQDGIVVHVCNVIANGTGKKEAIGGGETPECEK